MEGYYYAGGAFEFPQLGQGTLKRVPADVETMAGIFRSMKLKSVLPDVDALRTPLLKVLKSLQEWNRETGAPDAALVFYETTHGILVDGVHRLCDAQSQLLEDGSVNTATVVPV